MKVIIMAGGTGGHVYPALAVADALLAAGHEVYWIGAPDSFESRVIAARRLPFEAIRVSGLRGKSLRRLISAPLLLLRSVADSMAVFRRLKPDVALGMGGFAAGPGGLAARLLGVPLVIHEQNAAAGMTNRWLARLANRVLIAFPGALPRGELVGNPVRADIAAVPAPEVRAVGERRPPRVLVLGGSQGAKALNERVPQALALMSAAERPQVTHQAGRTLDVAQKTYAASQVPAEVLAFIDDMPKAYADTDLLVCRAGASTIAEICAAGCAAVFVPFPYAVDDHQTQNARPLVEAGAAMLIPESELSPQRLADTLRSLLAQPQRLMQMAHAAREMARPQATQDIMQAVLAAGARA